MKKLLCLMLAIMLALSSMSMAFADETAAEPVSETPAAAEASAPAEQPAPASEPAQSSNPAPASEPAQPSNPAPASEPAQPSNPAPASEPAQSSNPAPASEPEQPSNPAPATEPEQPSNPAPATEPEQPSNPAPVTEPEQPSNPAPATEPEQPSNPAPATEPEQPSDPAPATEPEQPSDPAPATEPEQPSDPAPATEPEQSSDPAPATEPEQPGDPAPATEPEQSSDPAPVADPDEPGDPAPAADPDEPGDPAPATDPDEPGDPAPATDPEEPVEPADEVETLPEDGENAEDELAEGEEPELLRGPGLEGIPGPGVVPTLKVTNAKPTSLTLTWTSPSTGADGYEMTLSRNADFSSPVIRDTTGTSYNVTGLLCGVTYYYRVRAYLKDGAEKVYGVYKSISYTTSPAAPSTLTANQTGASQVKLTWSSVAEADGYVIVWGDIDVAIVGSSTTTFTHNGVDLSLEYKYRVYSYKNVNGSRVRSDDYAEAPVIKMVVPAPQNLKAVSVGTNSVKLTWDKVDSAQYYVIQRDADGSYADLATVTTNSYTDSNLMFGKDYKYVVTAYVTADIHSDPCNPVVGNAVGEAPANLKASMANTSSITVTWDKTSFANGYRLESSPDKSTWTTAYEGPANTYSDTGLSAGDKRYYRVSAYVNTSGGKIYTATSPVVSCIAGPGAPTVTVENTDYDKQKVSWTDLGSGVKYEFQLSTNSAFSSPVARKTTNTYYPVSGCGNATTYYYRVRGYLEVSSTEIVYGPWSATVAKQTAPATPSVTATPSGNSVTVTWGTVNGATSYRVFVKKGEGSYSQVGTATAPTTTYTVKNLEVGASYFFGVRAVRTSGGKDAVSAMGESTEVFLDVAGFVPSGFSDTRSGDNSVKVSWKNPTGGVSKYEVKATSSDDTAFNMETTVTSNSVDVTGMKKGCEYQVEVRSKVTVADGSEQYSAWSTPYTIMLKTVGPSSLSLTSGIVAFAVSVDWTPSTGAEGYIIERADAPEGGYSQVIDLGDGSAKHYGDYSFTSADAGKPFYYRICSYSVVGGNKAKSAYTGPVKVVLNMPRPTVTATPMNKGRINLSWTDLGASKYEIYRSTKASSGFTLYKTVTTNSYSDTGVSFGTVYYYKVRGIKTVGGNTITGSMSTAVSAEPKTVAPVITLCSASGTSVTVKWNAAAGATGYNVYYHLDGQGWSKAGSTTNLTYTVTGLQPESLYFFRVAGTATAKNGKKVEGLFSAETSVTTTTTTVGQVTSGTASPVNLTSCKLTWTKVTDATGYEVQFATYFSTNPSRHDPWYDKATVTTNSATITGLRQSKQYHFRVRAFVTQGSVKSYGPWSTFTYVGYSAPVAPTNFRGVMSNSSNISLAWNGSSGAAGYRIWYKKSTDTNFSVLVNLVGSDITDYTVTGLSSKTTYKFKIQAFGQEDKKLYGTMSGEISYATK